MNRLPFWGQLRWQDLPEYHPPALRSARALTIAWVTTAALNAGWWLSLAIAAATSDGAIDELGDVRGWWWLGGALVGLVAGSTAVGIAWSLVYTVNIRRLGGRLPSRIRAVRAWVVHLACVLFAIGVLQLDPTRVFDVRPLVASAVFVIGAWRPYALIRRMFTSLSRIRQDTLVISLAFLSALPVGVLIWQSSGAGDGGGLRGLAGVASAAAIAAAASGGLVLVTQRAMVRSQRHRISALQVQAEHRYARSLGLNPLEPSVFEALVRAKLEREAHAIEARRASDPAEAQSRADTRADGVAAPATQAVAPAVAREPLRIVEPVEAVEAVEPVEPVEIEEPDDEFEEPDEFDEFEHEFDEPDDEFDEPDDDGMPRLPPRAVPVAVAGVVDPPVDVEDVEDVEDDVYAEREARDAWEPYGEREPYDDPEGYDDWIEDDRPAASYLPLRNDFEPASAGSMAALELSRYVMLGALLAAAGSSLWVVARSFDLSAPVVGGRLSDTDVDGLDIVRHVTLGLVAAVYPFQLLWMWVTTRVAVRTKMVDPGRQWAGPATASVAAVGAAAAALPLAGWVGAAGPWLNAAGLLLAAGMAVPAVRDLTPLISHVDRSPAVLRLWMAGLGAMALLLVAWGVNRAVTPTTSTGWLAFFGLVEMQVIALTAVVAGGFALEFEDLQRGVQVASSDALDELLPRASEPIGGSSPWSDTDEDVADDADRFDDDAFDDAFGDEAPGDAFDDAFGDEAPGDAFDDAFGDEPPADDAFDDGEPESRDDEADSDEDVAPRRQRRTSRRRRRR